jgi:hypothetical protein
MTPRTNTALVSTFVALRFATGVAAWLAPTTTSRAMGLGTDQQPLTAQLFGSRELTLAVSVAASTAPALRVRALQLGVLVDALDVLATVRGVRAGTLSTTGVLVSGGGAALFAAMGIAVLNQIPSPPSTPSPS